MPENNESNSSPLIEQIYNKIVEAIGGDAADQYFAMMMPGTVLNPDDYKYEGEKPTTVMAKESKLTNVLFDPAFIVNSDNGKKLYQQYKSSLNALSPKLNPIQSQMKTALRELLLKPFSYDFGDGIVNSMTFSQVFYKLYEEYIAVKSAWTREKLNKKQEIKSKYYSVYDVDVTSNDSTTKIKADKAVENEYLEWYEGIAEARELEIEEKMGKVLSIFSPGDMNIINGVLESSSGEEIEEARTVLRNAERIDTDGGKVYPVELMPSNWADYLECSFSKFDLLESPAAITMRIHRLENEKATVSESIMQIASQVPDEKEYEAYKEKVAQANKALDEVIDACESSYLKATAGFAKSLVELLSKNKSAGKDTKTSDIDRLIENSRDVTAAEGETPNIQGLIDSLADNAVECYNKQSAATDAIQNMANALMQEKETDVGYNLRVYVEPLKNKLDALDKEIAEQKGLLQLAVARGNDAVTGEKKTGTSLQIPNDDRFTQVLISSSESNMKQSSSSYANSSVSSSGVSFFFGGYKSKSQHSEAQSEAMSEDGKTTIEIAMNIVKVGVQREWFNPGVFQLTKDMNRFTDARIAPPSSVSLTEGSDAEKKQRFDDMSKTIFPVYPVSFVVAKDVSIRLYTESSFNSTFSKEVEDHASKGGGFLIFSSNKSSSSSSSESNAVAQSNGNEITIKFTAPQILGYYMQTVTEDKSTLIDRDSVNKDDTINGFVAVYKKFIDDLNKKNAELKN